MNRFFVLLAFICTVLQIHGQYTGPQEVARQLSAADSVAISSSGHVEEFSRELESVVFVPKGQWITGVSVSYSQSNQNKYQFLILEGLSGDTYTFKLSPMLMFAVANDLALGGRFSYSHTLAKVDSAELTGGPESGYNVDR
ncbi:MAG: hypothetical protein K2J24_10050, partial [Muribaculaceae bacterium]|nr:hypothetical protein [Muribaculaceae bacterium]